MAEQIEDELTTIVALLHDVVEDTDNKLDDLLDMGFPKEAVSAIQLMTHDEKAPYMDYVKTNRANEIARNVKLADLCHNSDLSRLDSVCDSDRGRFEKYQTAIALLEF